MPVTGSLPAPRLRHLGRPQAGGLGLAAQLLQHGQRDVLVLVIVLAVALDRQDVRRHEGAVTLAEIFDLGSEREIH